MGQQDTDFLSSWYRHGACPSLNKQSMRYKIKGILLPSPVKLNAPGGSFINNDLGIGYKRPFCTRPSPGYCPTGGTISLWDHDRSEHGSGGRRSGYGRSRAFATSFAS